MGKRCLEDLNYELQRKKFVSNKCGSTNNLGPGEILTDITGKQWQLGRRIGTGGFGVIFLASDNLSKNVTSDDKYICKIEEHKNGPLFVERNCYLRIAKLEMIKKWKAEQNLKVLGMPHYVASGSHVFKNNKYRFLIIPKYDCDLEQIFNLKGKRFNIKTVCLLATQILNILEYIHDKGYVHADIKASNILLENMSFSKSSQLQEKSFYSSPYLSKVFIRCHGTVPLRSCRLKTLPKVRRSLRPNGYLKILNNSNISVKSFEENKENQIVYLLDYGLATKYLNPDNSHKIYCRDERKAHAGTILFCSVDAHNGAQSRRSDLECLGYNIIYWLTGSLPWEDDLCNPEIVENKKRKCLKHLKEFLVYTFNNYPKFIYDFFVHLQKLNFCAKPDYDYYRNLFKNAIIEHGYKNDNSFDFDSLEKCTKRIKRANIENTYKVRAAYLMGRSPLSVNMSVKALRKSRDKNISWSKILIDPEDIMKQSNKDRKSPDITEMFSTNIQNLDIYSLNPTPAMMDVYNRCMQKNTNNGNMSGRGDSIVTPIVGYTPAMMAVHAAKEQRKRKNYEELVVNSNNNKCRQIIKQDKKKKYEKGKKILPMITRSITHHTTRREMRKLSESSFVKIYRLRE